MQALYNTDLALWAHGPYPILSITPDGHVMADNDAVGRFRDAAHATDILTRAGYAEARSAHGSCWHYHGPAVDLAPVQAPDILSMNDNSVQWLGHYGSDWTHAQSAWTSTFRDLTEEKRGRMPKLLAKLAADGHHTPFEKSTLHFLVTSEIASHIHALKHRIAVSINGESARYKELQEDRFYLPVDWPAGERAALRSHCEECFTRYRKCLERLAMDGIDRKRAKESARFYLPYATQVQWDVSFNFRSFIHFLGLRHKPTAQKEIYDISDTMLRLVQDLPENPFQHTLAAFGYGKETA